MKPPQIAIPLVLILAILIIGISAGPMWVADTTAPVRVTIASLMRSVSGFGGWFEDVKKLQKNRDELAKERNQLLAEVATLQAAKRENEAIKKQFNIDKSQSKHIIMAHTAGIVRQGDIAYLLIDKGGVDGLEEGQLATSNGVLVGRIKQLGKHSALLELPISMGSKVPVVIRHGHQVTKGVIEGNFNLTAKLTQVLPTDTLAKGDVILTSADGGIYPSDIVVGKVGEITQKDSAVFKTAAVELLWDIDQLEHVFIAL
jgi:rod shape-determining protein MreC